MCSSGTTEASASWSAERTLALPGRCSGRVLARWAENLRRRFGDAALARVRDGLPSSARALPDDPPEHAWLPIGVQLRLTELVVAECLGGDASALGPLLFDDIRRALPIGAGLVMRTLGPARILARAEQIHPSLYDVGRARASVEGRSACIVCEGAAAFAQPTFVLLQTFAQRGLVELTGRRVASLHASCPSDDALTIELRWR